MEGKRIHQGGADGIVEQVHQNRMMAAGQPPDVLNRFFRRCLDIRISFRSFRAERTPVPVTSVRCAVRKYHLRGQVVQEGQVPVFGAGKVRVFRSASRKGEQCFFAGARDEQVGQPFEWVLPIRFSHP